MGYVVQQVGEQLGEVCALAPAAVEVVDLGAAGEAVGEHDGVRGRGAYRGQQPLLRAGERDVAVAVRVPKDPTCHGGTLKREGGKLRGPVRWHLVPSSGNGARVIQLHARLWHGVIRERNFLIAFIRSGHAARGIELESRLLQLLLACRNNNQHHIVLIENAR